MTEGDESDRLKPTRSRGPYDYPHGNRRWDPDQNKMVDPAETPRRQWRGRRRKPTDEGVQSLQQVLPVEGVPEPSDSGKDPKGRRLSWEEYKARYEPVGHEGESPPRAWPYRKVSPKLPPVEPEPLDPAGEPIDWEACGEKPHLMNILDSSPGQLELAVPDELTDWWWEDGWDRRYRADGTVAWYGIDYTMIVRRQLNPLMPDAGSRGGLMGLPLYEWPAKAALGWAMWATHGVITYTRQIESLTAWFDDDLVQRLLDWGIMPLPLLNLTELSRLQAEALLNGRDKLKLAGLRELAEAAFPPAGSLCWFGLYIGRKELPDPTDGWQKRLVSLPDSESPIRTGEVQPLRANIPLALWTDWLLTRLRAVFPEHFPINSLGFEAYLIAPADEHSIAAAIAAPLGQPAEMT